MSRSALVRLAPRQPGLGTDAESVVDPQLRIHHVDGLWVADASAMPTITTCNTNAPAVPIGWRAAKMIAA